MRIVHVDFVFENGGANIAAGCLEYQGDEWERADANGVDLLSSVRLDAAALLIRHRPNIDPERWRSAAFHSDATIYDWQPPVNLTKP